MAGRKLEEYLDITVASTTVIKSEGTEKVEKVKINHYPCSDAELGLDGTGESKFSPLIDD